MSDAVAGPAVDTMNGYTLRLASDVQDRDGLALELLDPAGTTVAEVFRDDADDTRTFVGTARSLDVHVLAWFLDRSRALL